MDNSWRPEYTDVHPHPSRHCIIPDLLATLPHGHENRAGFASPSDRQSYRETRTSPTGRGIVCISAAIPAYSDYSRPSADILLRSGYPRSVRTRSYHPHQHEMDDCEMEERMAHREPDCRPFLTYRSHSGLCNNLAQPHWGNATQAYIRMSPRTYMDGADDPRMFSLVHDEKGGRPIALPNPRALSVALSQTPPVEHPTANAVLSFFGQFVAHDLALTPTFQINNKQPDCCILNAECAVPECLQFSVPHFDPFYSRFNITCHQFARTLASKFKRCKTGIREQFSMVSHWLDLSPLYGLHEERSDQLRVFESGLLRFRDVETGIENDPSTAIHKQILPSLPDGMPSSCRPLDLHRTCFFAGDDRVNQQPPLLTIHTILVRYHNAIASFLANYLPSWSDELIYQEARKFVVAVYQVVIYKEFLPAILGELRSSEGREHPLQLLQDGFFSGYDETSDPHVLNEFTTAAFRLHTLLGPNVPRLLFVTGDPEETSTTLSSQFNNQTLLYEDGSADSILSGMLEESSMVFDGHHSEEIRGRLFRGDLPFGLDLFAIDIQRGRDHGIGTYNDLREACGFGRASEFAELEDMIPEPSVALLHKLYMSVDDIDLMVGGVLETPTSPDSDVGPTFACIITMEFHNRRVSDRYWHENPDQFTSDQLDQLRQVTMAEIICQTTALRHVPSNAFAVVSDRNALMPCKLVPEMNLAIFFKEAKSVEKSDRHAHHHPHHEEDVFYQSNQYNMPPPLPVEHPEHPGHPAYYEPHRPPFMYRHDPDRYQAPP
ncbi:peroxidase-like [Paramacrobiotus metropolitanus]|uniref:peroxidase-like n=1 Tax=Paramacrobiotus metropolitanus TaxID=2943436 RepID=UPI0024461D17|nr:peroxidase-like [Paramacrobiotus metropolitanus]